MSKIFLVAKEAHTLGFETGKSHCYLVYEMDTGERFVTSLSDVTVSPGGLRFNVTQISIPYDQAQETSDLNRVERQLDFGGRDVDAVWSLITQHALEIKAEKPLYYPLTQNSTSFIASLLNVVGLDFANNLPGFNGNHPTNNPQPSDYPGLNNLLDFDYRLTGTPTDDVIRGAGGSDILRGEGGADTLVGKQGSDVLDGGPGLDTAGYFGPRSVYAIAWQDGATVFSNFEGIDRLYNIESLHFADKVEHITPRPLDYIASYADLIAAFGASPAAGFDHYLSSGFSEGRTVSFDGLEYIASYGDLINAFGANDDGGATHYIQSGRLEGRTTTFDGLEYIASYGDLITASHNQVAADPDPDIGATHYIANGYAEGRAPALFDPAQYLANYADLQAAFGTNTEAATIHYITAGYFEGRTDHSLV
jgi:RTX calcium-binding nonapeptide repeat (4 copies)